MTNRPIGVSNQLLLETFLLISTVFSARIYRVIDQSMQPVVLGSIAVIILYYTVLCAVRRSWQVLGAFFALSLLIVYQMYAFVDVTSAPLNLNSGFQFVTGISFPIFYFFARYLSTEYLMRRVLFYSTLYVVAYAAVAMSYQFQSIPRSLLSAITLHDSERGERLYIFSGAAAYAWFFWLAKIKSRPSIWAAIFLVISGTALALALSRVLAVCIGTLSLLYVSRIPRAWIGVASFATLCFVSLTLLYGLFDPRWNPFLLFASDSSGAFRATEYLFARDFILHRPVSGLGIAANQTDLLNKAGLFFSTDLGPIGVWMDFGALGLFLFTAGSYISCMYRTHKDLNTYATEALFLTGCYMGVYGCIAPQIFYPPAATYFACLFGLWLADRSRRSSFAAIRPLAHPSKLGTAMS